MKRTMFSLTLLLILSVALSGCSIVGSRISHALGDEENYIMNEEIITEKVESIDIDWRVGKVAITPWDGEDIVVKEKSDTTLTSRTKMRVRNQDGNLTIEDTAKGVWLLPLLFKKDLEVMVPVGVDLRIVDVKATSSSVYISELSVMDVNIESTSGDIVLDEMKVVGNTSLKSASGKIDADMKAGVTFKAETASGSINTSVSESLTSLDAKSASGSLSIAVKDTERINTLSASGKVELTVEGKCSSIDAVSSSGGVKLNLGEATTGFMMTASSTSGRVQCDFPSSVIGDQYTWGDGSTKIRLRSTSGRVHAARA